LNNLSFDIEKPLKWDTEHPNLYSLRISVVADGKVVEVVKRNFGFKQTEVQLQKMLTQFPARPARQ